MMYSFRLLNHPVVFAQHGDLAPYSYVFMCPSLSGLQAVLGGALTTSGGAIVHLGLLKMCWVVLASRSAVLGLL